MSKKHKGLLTPKTIEALEEADQALTKAYALLEHAAILASEDIAGAPFNGAAQDAARTVHPMYTHVWEMLNRMDHDGWDLQKYLKLEQGREQ